MSHASRTHDHTEEGRQAYNHFTYRTYKKDGEACTGHYIREYVLNEIVLEDLHRVTSAAREHPEKFAAYIGSKQSAELQREIRRQEKKLAAIRKRKAELDAIFKKLYEDSVLGRITTEQFQMLSDSYTEEQNLITVGISQKEDEIQRLRETAIGTDSFLDKAKRYTDITTTALAMSAAASWMWKKRWKHRTPYKPRKRKNPGRHRRYDDLPGYPRNHLLPLSGGNKR